MTRALEDDPELINDMFGAFFFGHTTRKNDQSVMGCGSSLNNARTWPFSESLDEKKFWWEF